jgi:hypothetical protein
MTSVEVLATSHADIAQAEIGADAHRNGQSGEGR